MRLSIVIPCYNESENIPLILEKFQKAMNGEDMEVILVNNGSTDTTVQVLKELLPQYPFAQSVRVPVNQGYGYGILKGLEVTRGDFLGWTHADLQTDPGDIVKAYHLLEENDWDSNIFVKGSRTGRSLADTFFTMGMGIFETIYLGKNLFDINAQPNIFPRSFYEGWESPPYDFSLDLYAMYLASVKNMRVVRFEVRFPPRIYGESHWNTGLVAKWKFIKRTINFSIKLKKDGIR